MSLALAAVLPAHPQVVNDSIHHSIALQLGATHTSYTAHCTVERNCVDESLTGKCIKYHNDQWFTFRSGNTDKLFVNVSGQRCKDLNGVQVVLLTGEPCSPSTYTILSCVSSGTNDDFYVEANVRPYTTYLLNVDGYLEDFCSFDITLDSVARGVPAEPNLTLPEAGELTGKVVHLTWTLPDTLSEEMSNFVIHKREKSSYRFLAQDTVTVARNTFGELVHDYVYTDTLEDHRTYFYRVTAQDYRGQHYLFADYAFRWRETRKIVAVPLNYRNHTPLTIAVWNASQNKILESHATISQKDKPKYWLDLTEYWNAGHGAVVIEVIDNKKKRSETTIIDIAEVKSIRMK
ncbi:MAG: hypothetical protein WA958_02350 [Tunicatimonas sp.]